MDDYQHIVKAWAFLNRESIPVSERRGDTLNDWSFNFDAVNPDAYQIDIERISRDMLA